MAEAGQVQEVEVVWETRSGRVRGLRGDGVSAFRGIPFAAPPVGSLRWRPPRPEEPWSGERDARRAGPAAPQVAGALAAMLGSGADFSDEDCLTLNAWTPACDAGRRPVLVWLHGGSFTSGSGGLAFYDGAGLARSGDVVVVTVNYRLGALGWLGLPALAREEGGLAGNFGLLDQIAALEWVREHAAALGGDPERVTLFGESAGAMSVGTLLGCPGAKGLFSRAILQSGAAHNVHDPDESARVALALADELGLDPEDTGALRAVPADAILAAQGRLMGRAFPGLRGLRFQPVVDGRVLDRPPLEAVAAGAAAHVPILAGTNLDEYKLFGLADPKAAALDHDALVRRCLRNVPGEHPEEGPHGERVVAAYREARRARDADHAPPDLWFAIESDRIFRVPTTRLLDAQQPHQAELYAYLFTWACPAFEGRLGACHALDLPFVFGRVDDPRMQPFIGPDPAAYGVSEGMQEAWLDFARGEEPRRWPRYEPGRRETRIWGPGPELESAPQEPERAFWEGIL